MTVTRFLHRDFNKPNNEYVILQRIKSISLLINFSIFMLRPFCVLGLSIIIYRSRTEMSDNDCLANRCSDIYLSTRDRICAVKVFCVYKSIGLLGLGAQLHDIRAFSPQFICMRLYAVSYTHKCIPLFQHVYCIRTLNTFDITCYEI